MPAVFISEYYFNRLSDHHISYNGSISRPDPCALGLYKSAFSTFGLFGSGVRTPFCLIGLRSDRVIDLYHFINLPTNREQGGAYQYNRNEFTKSLCIIFAFLFGAIGTAFCAYGVYKRREIGGSAYALLLGGWAFIGFGSYFVIALIGARLPLPF